MMDERKALVIKTVITALNEKITKENKALCAVGQYWNQKPTHGADTFFKMAFMEDDAFEHMAKACGL